MNALGGRHGFRNCGFFVDNMHIYVANMYIRFNIHDSVHRNSILIRSNKMQQYAGIYLLKNYSTCFGCPSHPSSGVHKTATAASGTGHITYTVATFPWRGLIRSHRRKVVTQIRDMTCTRSCSYSFMYSDNGCDGHPKHVE